MGWSKVMVRLLHGGPCTFRWLRPFQSYPRWWFQTLFVLTPICGRFPFWPIFFKGVETTKYFAYDYWSCPIQYPPLKPTRSWLNILPSDKISQLSSSSKRFPLRWLLVEGRYFFLGYIRFGPLVFREDVFVSPEAMVLSSVHVEHSGLWLFSCCAWRFKKEFVQATWKWVNTNPNII